MLPHGLKVDQESQQARINDTTIRKGDCIKLDADGSVWLLDQQECHGGPLVDSADTESEKVVAVAVRQCMGKLRELYDNVEPDAALQAGLKLELVNRYGNEVVAEADRRLRAN